MKDLQTVAMGLVIVFIDAGSAGWDWVADPLGWILVLVGLAALKDVLPNYGGVLATGWVCLAVSILIYSPHSVATIDDSLGWMFSLPTIAFCFLICDALMEITDESLAMRLKVLRNAFVLVAAMPVLVYGGGWDWLEIPSFVVAVVANIALVFSLWDAGNEEPVLLEAEPGDEAASENEQNRDK